MNHWLFKSEPEAYSIDDLQKSSVGFWDGVRNYQARNFLRDSVKKGDQVLFYHSNANPSGVAGIAEILEPGSPDPTQFDPSSPYFDPKAKGDSPRWFGVRLKYIERFPVFVSLAAMKEDFKLQKMMVVQKGSRLSIQPVSKEEFIRVCFLGGLHR